MKIIVCDTGPILHLREAGILDLLERIGSISVPRAVHMELSEIDVSWKDQKPSWISVEVLPQERVSYVIALCDSALVDIGEAEAIVLAQHLKADWLLTDDTSARIFANLLGLEVHGSLGVVLWAAATEHLKYDDAKAAIARLAQSSLWISQNILEKAYKALDEMFG